MQTKITVQQRYGQNRTEPRPDSGEIPIPSGVFIDGKQLKGIKSLVIEYTPSFCGIAKIELLETSPENTFLIDTFIVNGKKYKFSPCED